MHCPSPALLRSPKGFRIIAKGWRASASLPWYAPKKPPPHFMEPHRGSASASVKTPPPPSIPNIPFIPFDAVLAQQRTELILKSFRSMMLRLIAHIFDHPIRIGLAHRERRIPSLPVKRGKFRPFLLHPHRARAFQFFDPLGQRDRAIHPCQDMNMIRHTTNGDSRTLQGRRNAAQISVHGIHLLRVRKPRHPVPCRKHQMHDHVGQRLGHPTSFDISRSSQTQFHQADAEPRWGSALGIWTLGTAHQGRLAKARQPFAMMQKPLGLQTNILSRHARFLAAPASQRDRFTFRQRFSHGTRPPSSRHHLPDLSASTHPCPKGTPHHSEGLVSLGEPTLERVQEPTALIPRTPPGF